MSDETYLTIKGRLTSDPETRFTPSGAAVANFSVAVNARKLDKQTQEWKDKPTKFWRCQAWSQGKLARAENIADGLKKGDSVIVYGELETREYEKDGQQRSVDEIRVEAIGKDLTFHGQAGEVQRPSNAQSQQFNQGGNFNNQPASNFGQSQTQGNFGNFGDNTNQQHSAGQPSNGGWGGNQPGPNTKTGNNSPGGWGAPPTSEPPF